MNAKLEAHLPRLLLVDGQLNQTGELVQALREHGMEVEVTDSSREALNALQQTYRDALLLEVPGQDLPSAQMVALTRKRFPFLPVVVLSDQKRMNEAIGALNAGAVHLIPIPCPAK